MKVKITLRGSILLIIWVMLTILIVLITQAWALGIQGQFKGYLLEASEKGQEGYTDEFKEALKEFAFAIKDYGMIALTFFGITLIGGIFNLHKKPETEGDIITRNATLIIFVISIMFLMCFITLLTFYSLIYPYIITTEETIFTLLNYGFGLFIASVVLLLFVLVMYFIRVSLSPKQIVTDK